MAVNTLHIPSMEMLTLQPGERLLTPGNTADLELRIPATIQGPKRTESAKGRIWVTDQRIVFVADSNAASSSSNRSYDAPPVLTSLVIPHSILLSTEFKLPTFSPNHILLSFLPDPKLGAESNLPSPGRGSSLEAKLTVGEGAGHGCWKRIEGERCRAEENRNQEEVLRKSSAPSQGYRRAGLCDSSMTSADHHTAAYSG